MTPHTSRVTAAAACTALALTVLSACGPAAARSTGPTAAAVSPHTAPPRQAATASRAPASRSPAVRGNCYLGACRITVSRNQAIAMDEARFGFGTLTVIGITADSVTVRAAGPGVVLQETSSIGGSPSWLNNLGIVVQSISGRTAVLLLSRA